MRKELAFGLAVATLLLWLTFFAAGPGTIEVATLAAAVFALMWFSTVDARRLVDASGRPQLILFGLAGVGLLLLVAAATLLSSATTFLILAVGLGALVTGVTRAVRYGMTRPMSEE